MLVSLMLALLLIGACEAESPTPLRNSQSVIIVVANRLVLSDMADLSLPAICKIFRSGAIGLISPNCVGAKTEASVIMTANAGAPTKGGIYIREFYNIYESLANGENAGDAYLARTGRRVKGDSAVFLGLAPALREAAKATYLPGGFGALGDALHQSGYKTCVDGSADTDGSLDRAAAALLVDSRGIVDSGAFSLEPSASDFEIPKINGRSVQVVYFGESTRLDELKMTMTDKAFASHKAGSMRSLDRLLNKLITNHPDATIVFVSFSPPISPSWDQLTPVAIYPSPRPGLLVSKATRTAGVIAASDFAPTLLDILKLPASSGMLGRPAEVIAEPDALQILESVETRTTTNKQLLLPMGVVLAIIGALSMTAAACVTAFSLKPPKRVRKLILVGLVTAASAACALLLAASAPPGALGQWLAALFYLVLLILAASVIARLFSASGVRALPIVAAYAITALTIIVDAVTGGNLCKFSGLSSFHITGMRFHGIGNEYAGVLIPTAALAVMFATKSRWMMCAAGVITIFTLGLGSLGANYGGTAAAVVTFVLLMYAINYGRFGARHVAIAFVVGIIAVPLFAALDWILSGGGGSHAAQATGFVERFGGSYIISIALRKILFNLKTTFSVKGISVLAAFAPFLTLWFWGVRGKLAQMLKQTPRVMAGTKAILVGSVAAFLFNDSGIVFAMAMIAITVIILLYSLVEEAEDAANSCA
ncbi:MAG: hypothetical protein ACOX3G_11315 [Armatimonadota bacterium]